MIHYMNLNDEPFNLIKEGSKSIEMRLNDERRSIIVPGDEIEFTNNKTNEKMRCEVIEIYIYKDFKELYKNHSKRSLGYKKDEVADYKDMNQYYSDEKIERYGVLAIQIKKESN